MQTIADSIEMFRLPGHITDLQGKDSVRKAYGFLNTDTALYCRILNRIVEKNMVIDHEEVFFQGATKPYYGIAIYHVKEGKIRRVYFYGW